MKVQVWMHVDDEDVLVFWTNIETDATVIDVANHIGCLVSCRFWPMLVDRRYVMTKALELYRDAKLFGIRVGDRIIVADVTFRLGQHGLEVVR